MRSNCLSAAFRRWWWEGGQFALEPSLHGRHIHAKYRPPGGEWVEFHPLEPKRRRRAPPLYFHGTWRLAPRESRGVPFGQRRHPAFWAIWLPVLLVYFDAVILGIGWWESIRGDRRHLARRSESPT